MNASSIPISVLYDTTGEGFEIELILSVEESLINPSYGATCYIKVKSDKITPTDKFLIPTGEFLDVTGTPMDFRTPKKVGKDINADFAPLKIAGGYDHNYALNLEIEEDEMDLVASLYDEKSGRFMEVYTDLPGMQLYSGNFMRKETGKGGVQYDRRYGICFETQFFPNACNTPAFESSIFDADVPFDYCTVYAFSVK